MYVMLPIHQSTKINTVQHIFQTFVGISRVILKIVVGNARRHVLHVPTVFYGKMKFDFFRTVVKRPWECIYKILYKDSQQELFGNFHLIHC